MKNKRIGKFRVSMNMAEYTPDIVRKIMGECIVIKCDILMDKEVIEYTAISPHFDEVGEYCITPEYTFIIGNGVDSYCGITFVKEVTEDRILSQKEYDKTALAVLRNLYYTYYHQTTHGMLCYLQKQIYDLEESLKEK